MTGYSIVSAEDNQSLYSYVMSTYKGKQKVINSEVIKEHLEYLYDDYNEIYKMNLQAESYETMKNYASKLDKQINSTIDKSIASLQYDQESIALNIEDLILSEDIKEISTLNRMYTKKQEEINSLLQDKTSIEKLFKEDFYNKVDTRDLESDIKSYENLLGSSSNLQYSDAVYLGELKELKRPFNCKPRVTSHAGYRTDPINGKTAYHNATDYGMPIGTELYSLFNGKVILSGNTGNGYGENIKIDCGDGIILHYAHMSERYVKVGDFVTQNQIIGLSGNTGRSTGPHLHLGLEINGVVESVEELF